MILCPCCNTNYHSYILNNNSKRSIRVFPSRSSRVKILDISDLIAQTKHRWEIRHFLLFQYKLVRNTEHYHRVCIFASHVTHPGDAWSNYKICTNPQKENTRDNSRAKKNKNHLPLFSTSQSASAAVVCPVHVSRLCRRADSHNWSPAPRAAASNETRAIKTRLNLTLLFRTKIKACKMSTLVCCVFFGSTLAALLLSLSREIFLLPLPATSSISPPPTLSPPPPPLAHIDSRLSVRHGLKNLTDVRWNSYSN